MFAVRPFLFCQRFGENSGADAHSRMTLTISSRVPPIWKKQDKNNLNQHKQGRRTRTHQLLSYFKLVQKVLLSFFGANPHPQQTGTGTSCLIRTWITPGQFSILHVETISQSPQCYSAHLVKDRKVCVAYICSHWVALGFNPAQMAEFHARFGGCCCWWHVVGKQPFILQNFCQEFLAWSQQTFSVQLGMDNPWQLITIRPQTLWCLRLVLMMRVSISRSKRPLWWIKHHFDTCASWFFSSSNLLQRHNTTPVQAAVPSDIISECGIFLRHPAQMLRLICTPDGSKGVSSFLAFQPRRAYWWPNCLPFVWGSI